ncbi:MAG: hypothetical protein NWF04_01345 [Candidatus Bathyarchaeota archaeon]|nr:hypothetical protein [Candidatus Bathyarchaeota archaeon]
MPSIIQAQQQIEHNERQDRVDALQGDTNPYLINMTKEFILHFGKNGATSHVSPEKIVNGIEVGCLISVNGEEIPVIVKIEDNHF